MKKIHTIPNEWQNIAQLFIALGDAHRQRILLAFEKDERLNILQIAAASTLSRTAVTHHLKILHQSGALNSEKIGKEVFFWVNKNFMTNAIQNVLHYIETEI
ncbi:MAG TPA: helix-turn-helix domain-containing protein [Methylotenera sp.]|nr:helix-turn-helix domain-containing protein [Methylotenera sp.]HPH04631.1 helix-turn-helix domain-containing protein [Methylotenera sp.]HPN01596.1 helix-turn-helix domain-containing protein [Methylotenera sp.]